MVLYSEVSVALRVVEHCGSDLELCGKVNDQLECLACNVESMSVRLI